VELSQYVLEVLRRDEEFVLCRGEPSNQPGSPSVLLLAPVSMQPALETLKKIASSGKSVGDGERQRAVAVRNRRNFLQVESKDLC
jgi:hypothetical protein